MSFDKKHGEFIFNVQEHLVTCELIGPFNEEGMLTWITEIKRVVNSLDGKRFCALVDHRQHQGVVQGEIVNILLKIKNSFLPTKQILIGL